MHPSFYLEPLVRRIGWVCLFSLSFFWWAKHKSNKFSARGERAQCFCQQVNVDLSKSCLTKKKKTSVGTTTTKSLTKKYSLSDCLLFLNWIITEIKTRLVLDHFYLWTFKFVQSFRVTCLFTGQYCTIKITFLIYNLSLNKTGQGTWS